MTSMEPSSHLMKLYQMYIMNDHINKMEQKNVEPKKVYVRNNDSCMVCDSPDRLKSLTIKTEPNNTNITIPDEDIKQMFLDCYFIEIVDEENVGAMCEECLNKLRCSIGFRNQVENADRYATMVKVDPVDDYDNGFETNVENDEPTSEAEKLPAKKTRLKAEYLPPKLPYDAEVCPVCDETNISYAQLKRHYFSHFHNFSCDICGKGFMGRTAVKRHMLKHQRPKHVCDKCCREFASKASLEFHITSVHLKKDIYKCRYCPETFKSFLPRSRHMLEKHNANIKTYPCKDCGTVFLSMTRHRLHQKNKQVCLNAQLKNDTLEKHMGSEGAYPCHLCGKLMKSQKYLKRHIVTFHHDTDIYPCPYCEQPIKERQGLMDHIRSLHSDQLYLSNIEQTFEDVPPEHQIIIMEEP